MENEIDIEIIKQCQNDFELASNVPHSDIIYQEQLTQRQSKEEGDNTDNDTLKHAEITLFKAKAYELYKKYIKIGTKYEINISYDERRELIRKMDNYDHFMADEYTINELLLMFEEAKKAMKILLVYSLNLYKAKPSFDKLLDIMDQEQNNGLIQQRIQPKTPITPDETSAFQIAIHQQMK